jgi:hypothetical protein
VQILRKQKSTYNLSDCRCSILNLNEVAGVGVKPAQKWEKSIRIGLNVIPDDGLCYQKAGKRPAMSAEIASLGEQSS